MRDYWRVLRRRKWWVLGAMVVTTLLALGWALTRSDVYSATAEVLVREEPSDSLFGTANVAVQDDNPMDTALQVLEGEPVAERVRSAVSPAAPRVSGTITDDSNVLRVSVEADDPGTAARFADAYARAFIEERRAQASANLLEVAEGLEDQVADLNTQIEAADQAVTAAIAEKEAQIADLRAQMATLQSELAQLNALTDLTTEQRVQQETIGAQIGSLQAQVDDATAAIARLEGGGGGDVRAVERDRLVGQRAVLLQRSSELQAASTIQSGGARVLRPAQVPAEPSNPQPVSTVIMGLIAGLILGMAVAFGRDYFDDSLTSPTDLDKLGTDVPLLAVVPVIPCSRGRSVGIVRPGSTGLEAFRTLRTNIEFAGINGDCRVLEVVSAQADEGKSTVAANLAVALAHAGRSVVLVDADLRAPRLHRFFDVDAGAVPPNPSELLAGVRLEAVIDELRLRFDYVIVDSAPLLPVSDALAIARYVDGVIVVAQSRRTRVGPLGQALAALDQVSAPVLGVVLNRVNPRTAAADGYTYGSEYGAKSKLPPEKLRQPTRGAEPTATSPQASTTPDPSATTLPAPSSRGASAAAGQ